MTAAASISASGISSTDDVTRFVGISRPCMGSVLRITLADVGAGKGEGILESAVAEAERVERLLSVFDPTSAVSRLNREAGRRSVAVDPELMWLLERARGYADATGGAVDITVAPLTRLWRACDDEQGGRAGLPSSTEIGDACSHVGWEKVRLEASTDHVAYVATGVEIEFGAMGKGYAVDRVVKVLTKAGVTSALVDFGSTAYAVGRPPNDEWWRVGIRHPLDPDRAMSVVRLADRAVSTSANDQQGIDINGVRYAHVIDPRSGWPSNSAASASVIAPTALDADALSTAALIMGPRDGTDLLQRFGADGVVVRGNGSSRLIPASTPGWRDALSLPHQTSRRRVLAGAAATLAAVFLGPALGHAVVYASPDEALRTLIPEANGVRQESVALSAEQRERIDGLVGRGKVDADVQVLVASRDEEVVGYGTVLNVIGKEQPITFMVAVSADERVRGVDVLAYRESQGSEIRSRRFLKQFRGKTVEAPLRLGREIHGISGATLSSRSTIHAVKTALALVAVVYGGLGSAS